MAPLLGSRRDADNQVYAFRHCRQKQVLYVEKRRHRSAKDPRERLGLAINKGGTCRQQYSSPPCEKYYYEASSPLFRYLDRQDLHISLTCRHSAAADGALLPSDRTVTGPADSQNNISGRQCILVTDTCDEDYTTIFYTSYSEYRYQ